MEYGPGTRRELVSHLDDLGTVWLHVGDAGCAVCQSHGRVVVAGCGWCGEGRW
jgi:hypothetical protein